jgi:hypothetical protein
MIARADAIELARQAAAQQGWPWVEPVRARRRRAGLFGPHRWEVLSNADSRGQNVRVVIDDASGALLERHFLPR